MTIDTKEQLYNLIERPSTIEISTNPWKYDYTIHTCVTKIGDKHYKFSYVTSYNEGTQFWNPIELIEVKPVEVTTIKWEKV